MHRGLIAVVALLIVSLPTAATAHEQQTRCVDLHPETAWTDAGGSVVHIEVADVPEGQVVRFVEEIDVWSMAIDDEIGGLDGATVCLVGPEAAFDPGDAVAATKRFHAVIDHDAHALFVSTERVGDVKPAAAFGMTHLALWHNSDGSGWPEPLASAIAHWYRARSLDRLELYHKLAMGADFSTDPLFGGGNFGLDFSTDARIDWDAAVQPPVRSWDPATNEQPIGDFIEYTVGVEGVEVLADTDPDAWTEREHAWRVALVQDLTGRTEPTTGWKGGVALVVGVLFVGTVLAVSGWWLKRRRSVGETPPPVPGLFTDGSP